MRRKRGAVVRLVVVVAVVLAAATYFLRIAPIYKAIHKGLDLQGGLEVVFQASSTPDQPLTAASLNRTVSVLGLRVNTLGVSEPVIQAEPGQNRILVELAGVKDPQQALQIIGKTAKLEFKDQATSKVIVTGAELQHADAQVQSDKTNVVAVTFNAKGKAALGQWTAANQNKPMGIYLDGQLLEAPNVLPGCCPNGNMVITGSQTFQDAQSFALQLNSGALPLTLTVLSENTVSATLGQASVKASTLAAVVALALVIAFMFLMYRIPGFWADIALLVYALLLMAVLVGINATLTLPGITGMILSVGMAVDSNVIIYERIREELRAGRSLRSAVDDGFRHGLRAILDSNATTVIAAVVLYYLGSGLIRGFAVTVGIGVVISLLTAVLFTRYLLRALVEAGSRPSWWFFAPRAALATAGGVAGTGDAVAAAIHGLGEPGAGAAVSFGSARRPARPAGGRATLTNLRRQWDPDIPVDAPPAAAPSATAADPAAGALGTGSTAVEPTPAAAPDHAAPEPGTGEPARETTAIPPAAAHRRGKRTGKRQNKRGGKGGR